MFFLVFGLFFIVFDTKSQCSLCGALEREVEGVVKLGVKRLR